MGESAKIKGWNGNNSIFFEIIERVRPNIIVEIGSWHGQSTITMARACKKLNLETIIYAIDTWLGALEFYTLPSKERDLEKKDGYPQVYYKFWENINRCNVADIIKPLPLPSNLGLKYLKHLDVRADVVYVDGSHEYEDVQRDIELARELSPKIIFGDDYTNKQFPGVKRAVSERPHKVIKNWYWELI
jgi:hypothetical protein